MAPEPEQTSATRTPTGMLRVSALIRRSCVLRIQDAAKYLSDTTWQIETLLREKIQSFVLAVGVSCRYKNAL
jgi:hypothetical protein